MTPHLRAWTSAALLLIVAPSALAAEVTIPRWELTLETSSEEVWSVEDRGDRVTVTRKVGDDVVGFGLRVRPASGCGAPVADAPTVPGLPSDWRYAGTSEEGDRWCLPASGGTIELGFFSAPDPVAIGLLAALAKEPLSAHAMPPTTERRRRYSLIIYPTFRRYMPARREDVVFGRSALRLDWAIEDRRIPLYGNGPSLAVDLHAMRGLAVGAEAAVGVRGAPHERYGLAYEARGLVGVGGWPLPWIGGAALVGVGVDGITTSVEGGVELPGTAILMVGVSRFGVEVLARTELGLGPERADINTLGPFDSSYLRVAGWVGEARTPEWDYTDYGRRSFWFGGYVREQYGARWIGVTLGTGITALPVP